MENDKPPTGNVRDKVQMFEALAASQPGSQQPPPPPASQSGTPPPPPPGAPPSGAPEQTTSTSLLASQQTSPPSTPPSTRPPPPPSGAPPSGSPPPLARLNLPPGPPPPPPSGSQKLKNAKPANEVVSLIASHNARIQCFLDKFKKTEKQVRFKNCAVLRMELTPYTEKSASVKISMVYPGELEVNEQQKDKVYYTTPSLDNIQLGGQKTLEKCEINKLTCLKNTCLNKKIKEVEFTDIETVIDEKTLKDLLNLKPNDIEYKYVFYIARHGQAEHNVYPSIFATPKSFKEAKQKFVPRKKDTSLTAPIGILQAVNAGMALSNVMKSYNESTVNYTFCSDLLRTRQTLFNIYKGFKSTTYGREIQLPDKMTVLPCTNELTYFKNANCDARTATDIGAKFAAENFPGCDMKQIKDANSPCRQMKDEGKIDTGITIKVDWSFYTPFYGNAFRNTRKKGTLHCRDTTMIAMAVKYISKNKTTLDDFVKERKTDSESKSKGGKTKRQTRRMKRRSMKKNKKSNKQTRKRKL